MKSTTDYGIFRGVKGNRVVRSSHVASLIRAIERKNLLHLFPIVVNEKMEVIDGQHRLSAAAALKVPIYYEQEKHAGIDDIIEINTQSRGWGMLDFIQSWASRGKKDYQYLLEFIEVYEISPTVAVRLLTGDKAMRISNAGGYSANRAVRSGDFKVTDVESAEFVANLVTKLDAYADFRPSRSRDFISALWLVVNDPEIAFSPKQLLKKLSTHKQKIERKSSVREYVLHLEDLYNFRSARENREVFYHGQV